MHSPLPTPPHFALLHDSSIFPSFHPVRRHFLDVFPVRILCARDTTPQYAVMRGLRLPLRCLAASSALPARHATTIAPLRPRRFMATSHASSSSPSAHQWSHPPTSAAVTDEEIASLTSKRQHALSLADLVKYILTINTTPLRVPG